MEKTSPITEQYNTVDNKRHGRNISRAKSNLKSATPNIAECRTPTRRVIKVVPE